MTVVTTQPVLHCLLCSKTAIPLAKLLSVGVNKVVIVQL